MAEAPRFVPTSSVEGIVWPSLADPQRARILALCFQLEQSEWWDEPSLAARAEEQLAALLRGTVAEGVEWGELPLIEDPQHDDLLPAPEPLMRAALEWRAHRWRAHDPVRSMIYVGADADGTSIASLEHRAGWGGVVESLGPTGAALAIPGAWPPQWQVAAIAEAGSGYLSTTPALLLAMNETRGRAPPVLGIATRGRPLRPSERTRVAERWGQPAGDVLDVPRIGIIAHRCREGQALHLAAEAFRVEILDAAGAAAPRGTIGRIVVTPLHQTGFEALRVATGFRGAIGPACACGRGLPVLQNAEPEPHRGVTGSLLRWLRSATLGRVLATRSESGSTATLTRLRQRFKVRRNALT